MIVRPSYRVMSKLVSYNPETGLFVRSSRPVWMFVRHRNTGSRAHTAKYWNARYGNKPAFTTNRGGYRVGTFLGKKMMAHRVAWLLHYGEWPSESIDHINGNPSDNRIVNLRVADQLINQKNAKRPKNNTSGAVGLSILKGSGRWRAAIKVNYREIHLGVFDRFEDAFRARKAAERKYGFHPNHGRSGQ